ncbi:MAG: [FeFe] hydrogenase, group A [Spirochaetaceae bacterium]|jgi:NADH-quinone oxidoreductase subunit G|nr:[FeFe] hydrogenase, group A [Spirochaetaceae bacterium]
MNVTINNIDIDVDYGVSILDAAKKAGFRIPTLCNSPDLPAWASCGLCIVRMAGTPRMVRACCTMATEGMKVVTHDPELTRARRTVLELILSNHPADCLNCARNNHCELQSLAAEFGVKEPRLTPNLKNQSVDDSYEEVVFDRDKCINCGRCVEVCQGMQNVWALEYTGRGDKTIIGPVAGAKLINSPCVKCGQCAAHCPVGAITTRNPLQRVQDALANPALTCVAAIAPSVRAALGEEFDLPVGTITTGKIYTALRVMGFRHVFDTNFAADVTIMEEGTELINRLTKGTGPLPMFTSCCPAWIDYAEKRYHGLLPHLSTTKSPQQIQGALTKTYWAKQMNVAPGDIFHLSIMPCAAKAWEARRDGNMQVSGAPDIDMVITTREFASLIRMYGIDFASLPESAADNPLGPYSGAATIFGATGGVMEAAVRTAYAVVEKKELGDLNFTPVRGLDAVKEAAVTLGGKEVRLAVVHQLGNVDAVVQRVLSALGDKKEPPYHFIEVMSCRGGCVAGGGQPYGADDEIRLKRAAALYRDDTNSAVRTSHGNPLVQEVYKKFLHGPNSHEAHHLLHTTYTERKLYS